MNKEEKDCCKNGNENHECKCNGHDHHDHEHEEVEMLELTLDDDTILKTYVLGIFEVEDKEYIALLPENDEKVLLYEYIEDEEGSVELKVIEEDEEFETVSEAYNELFSEEDEEE